MPDTTEEFVVTGASPSTTSNYSDDWWRIQEQFQRLLEQAGAYTGDRAFAPPMTTPLPEVPYSPPPVQRPPAPPVVAPARTITQIIQRIPILGLIIPSAGGPPGTGDAPDEPSSVHQRYADTPPPPPPPIIPEFAEPQPPPNWWDLINEPFPITRPVPMIPIPLPEVEMPPGERFFEVSPPLPTTRAVPEFPTWSLPIGDPFGYPNPFGSPFDFPSPGPGPAPTPVSPPGIYPDVGFPDPFLLPDRVVPGPGPSNPVTPDVLGSPLPDIVGNPIGDPFITPSLPDRTRPDTGNPDPGTRPRDIATPIASPFDPVRDWQRPDVEVTPFPDADPFGPTSEPPRKTDTCACGGKEKKPKKKKPPRAECWRGTYRQLAKGMIYKRLEQIPCVSGSSKKKAPRTPTTLPDIFNFN